MQYDFDLVYDRKNTDSIKWNLAPSLFGCEDVIPMWVADMDFPVAQPIVEALQRRAEHPFYGYARAGESVIEAIINRLKYKFNWKIEPEWVVFTPGVVPALHVAIRSLTHPGDGIVLQPPVYHPFYPAVTASGCQIVANNLKLANGRYEMDYAGLESRLAASSEIFGGPNRVKAILFCNPQNPVGRLWGREELVRLGEIALNHGAAVISDEIHCEILFKGYRHVPFASISAEFAQNSIVCLSPSKTFSLAGLEISTIIIPNRRMRESFESIRGGILPSPNLFGYVALEAAYRYGDEWLEQVLEYLQGNLDFLQAYVSDKIPRIKVIPPQGTYLIWLDCRGLGLDNQALKRFMCQEARVGLEDGYVFGEAGSGFQRMNIACPRSLLAEALQRIEKAVNRL